MSRLNHLQRRPGGIQVVRLVVPDWGTGEWQRYTGFLKLHLPEEVTASALCTDPDSVTLFTLPNLPSDV